MVVDLGIEQIRSRDWMVTRVAVRGHRRLGRRGSMHVVDWQNVAGLTPSALALPGQGVAQLLAQFEGQRPIEVADAIRELPSKRRYEVVNALGDERLADILHEARTSEAVAHLDELTREIDGLVATSLRYARQRTTPTRILTALMLAGSHLTVDALEAVRALDIAVPEALSIVGFNDSAALGWWGAGVTSVGLPVFDIAAACAGGLLAKLRQAGTTAQVARPPSEAMFTPFLVERGSTARPAPR